MNLYAVLVFLNPLAVNDGIPYISVCIGRSNCAFDCFKSRNDCLELMHVFGGISHVAALLYSKMVYVFMYMPSLPSLAAEASMARCRMWNFISNFERGQYAHVFPSGASFDISILFGLSVVGICLIFDCWFA
jgi:hypothetical protein